MGGHPAAYHIILGLALFKALVLFSYIVEVMLRAVLPLDFLNTLVFLLQNVIYQFLQAFFVFKHQLVERVVVSMGHEANKLEVVAGALVDVVKFLEHHLF